MLNTDSIRALTKYNDWADQQLIERSGGLTDEQLDRPFDMGVGALRRTLLHIYNGEHVWLERWQGRTETPWPSEEERVDVSEIAERLNRTHDERGRFLERLNDKDLGRTLVYRDSKGKLFSASLSDMVLQMLLHSTHHRAQAVNMIRRVGGQPPELDYMVWVRKPA